MDFFKQFHSKIKDLTDTIARERNIDIGDKFNFVVETPKNEAHGDISTNIAMILCKKFSLTPLELGLLYKQHLEKLPEITSVSVVNPGFINITVENFFWQNCLGELLKQGDNFGRSNIGCGKKINLEYVSANPTGPLHVGHGRGAVVGDVLAEIYKFLGYEVTKEYYINDAGGQIEVLGKSLYYRYYELYDRHHDIARDDNFYPGEYLIDTVKKLSSQEGDRWLSLPKDEVVKYFKTFVLQDMMLCIKEDLDLLGVKHDIFSSEKEIANDIEYGNVLNYLAGKDLVYMGTLNPPKGKIVEDFEAREQKLFRATLFGDDTDRPLEKSNLERTYFANDMIYHYDKIKRGYDYLINIWGADHVGYIKRMCVAVDALSEGKIKLDIITCQMVNLLKDGSPYRMSKRAGNFVTLKDLIQEVGRDVYRFMMISRKNDVTFDLDLNVAKEQSVDNPIFYIQYAYARVHSVLENANEHFSLSSDSFRAVDFSLLKGKEEIILIKNLLKLPRYLENALQNNDPHKIYLYLMEISSNFHTLWNAGREDSDMRFIIKNNQILTIARLSLLKGVAICIKNMLQLLGVNIKEKM